MGSETTAAGGFGPLLRAAREKAGLSQSALARRAGLDPSFVNRLESGQRGAERAVAEALVAALELSQVEADRLLAAGGHLPPDFARLGLDDPTLRLVVQVLTDDQISSADRDAFRQAVAAARAGRVDPTLRLVAEILADERLSQADRAAFREIVELLGRRWRPGSERA